LGPPIHSPRILSSPHWLARIERASEGLEDLLRHPTRDAFLELSERFTDRLGLGSPALYRMIGVLRRTDSWVAQAMFGNTFLVVPRSARARARMLAWLTDHAVAAIEVNVGRQGARRLPVGTLRLTGEAPVMGSARRNFETGYPARNQTGGVKPAAPVLPVARE
jgi:hypothetical protein